MGNENIMQETNGWQVRLWTHRCAKVWASFTEGKEESPVVYKEKKWCLS